MNILDAIIAAVPYIKQIIGGEMMIGVTDLETFLLYEPSDTIDFGLKAGDPIPQEDQNLRTALAGQHSSTQLPAEIYGKRILATAIPVRDDQGVIVGALAMAQSYENQERLEDYMGQIEGISSRLVDMVQNVAAHSEELSATSEHILDNSKNAVQESANINKTIDLIGNISNQTNILGLNARSRPHGPANWGPGLMSSPRKFASCPKIRNGRRRKFPKRWEASKIRFGKWNRISPRSLHPPRSKQNWLANLWRLSSS